MNKKETKQFQFIGSPALSFTLLYFRRHGYPASTRYKRGDKCGVGVFKSLYSVLQYQLPKCSIHMLV